MDDGELKVQVNKVVFFFQAEDGIRDLTVTGVQTCALPISFVIQRSTEPARYEVAQMNLPPVFKFMNDMTNDSTTAVCGHCGFEMKCAMSTVRTRERARDRTFERFGAFLAKRRDDAGCLCFANIA